MTENLFCFQIYVTVISVYLPNAKMSSGPRELLFINWDINYKFDTCIGAYLLCCTFSVRQKVKELLDFIQDDDKLREERKKAKKNKDKYIGMSADSMGYRGGGGYSKFSVFCFNIIWPYTTMTVIAVI